MKGDPKGRAFATRAIHAGQTPDPLTGAVSVPIYQTSTYQYLEAGKHTGYEYARVQNPTRRALERNIASLEDGLDGHAFASGMAAISSMMTMVPSDHHVVASRTVYGGTYRLFEQVLDRYRLRVSWVDTRDLDAIASALRPETRLVFLESPTNPLMEITDIAAVAELAHRRDITGRGRQHVPLALPAATAPARRRSGGPLDHQVPQRPQRLDRRHRDHRRARRTPSGSRSCRSRWARSCRRSTASSRCAAPRRSRCAWTATRRTPARWRRSSTAIPRCAASSIPGSPHHPGHDVQRRQASGFGAMIAFDLGSLDAANALLNAFEVFTLAESLGGVESLVSHPATMTHAAIPEAEREALGVGPGLVRLSVGIEDAGDLLGDLERALQRVP